jgi:hypothetical protein
LLVVGAGRSGTSAFAGAIAALGYTVPPPEIRANSTNPKGFGEPRWVVNRHKEMLGRHNVHRSDPRPYAWRLTSQECRSEANQKRLRDWLGGQFADYDRLVVKDPRTTWFTPLWRQACRELDADLSVVTMLRPPAEAVGSARNWRERTNMETRRLAGWVNVQLRTERVTREDRRAFVHYRDLLADPVRVMTQIDRALELGLDLNRQAAIDDVRSFLEPSLRHATYSLDQLDVVPMIKPIAGRVWKCLGAISKKDTPATRRDMDALRAEYRRLYRDAEQVTFYSILTGTTDTRKHGRPRSVGLR